MVTRSGIIDTIAFHSGFKITFRVAEVKMNQQASSFHSRDVFTLRGLLNERNVGQQVLHK